jgi:hypothetical protein
LSVAPQNRWREDGTGHASRSDGSLLLEESRTSDSQSSLNTGEGARMGGARGSNVEDASGSS